MRYFWKNGTIVRDTTNGDVGVVIDGGYSWGDIKWDGLTDVSIGEPTWKLERI